MSCRRCGGKLFHTRGPVALKLRSPKLFRVRALNRAPAEAARSRTRASVSHGAPVYSPSEYTSANKDSLTGFHGLLLSKSDGIGRGKDIGEGRRGEEKREEREGKVGDLILGYGDGRGWKGEMREGKEKGRTEEGEACPTEEKIVRARPCCAL